MMSLISIFIIRDQPLKIQNSGQASIAVGARDMVKNEEPRRETGGERDEDAAMDVWSHEERFNQIRTCDRISKSSTTEDHREKAKVVC